jgi:hypothetical protein
MEAINLTPAKIATPSKIEDYCKRLVCIFSLTTLFLFSGISLQAQTFCPSNVGSGCNNCPDYSVIANPDLTVACQDNLNITIIVDESNSLEGSQNLVRNGVLALLQNLECNQVNVALIEFGSVANYVIPSYTLVTPSLITSVTNYFNGTPLNGQVYTVPQPNNQLGGTNWQAALLRANALPAADLVFMITDGVPTTYTVNANQPGSSYDFCGDGSSTQEAEIYNAVQLANAIKAKGSKMFILGVGGDLNAAGIELIKDISGDTLFNPAGSGDAVSVATADYGLATNINDLSNSLAALSANLCPLVTDLETTAVCGVDGTNGTITIDITTNADAPYTITINNGTPIITNNTQTVVSNLPAGSYEVTVSANDICFETATSTVEVTEVIVEANAGSDAELTCTTTSVTLNGSGSSTNPNANLTYAWSGPDGFTADTEDITVSAVGTYTLTVTDTDNGCFATDSAEVTADENAPTANAGSDAELTCTTTSVTLNGSGSSTNPDANLTYAWSGPDGFTADTEDITVSAVGTYTLTVTDTDNGCFATDSAEVTADENAPTANAGSDAELTCTTTSVTLNGSGSSTNPDANLTYAWSGPGGFTADTEDITVSAVGTYTLTVTDTDNGCFATDSAEVTADKNAPTANAGSDAELTCTTTSVTLDGSGSSTNPNANLTYAWSGPDGFTADTEDITVSAVGTYTLTVTDTDNGCFATDSAEVTADENAPTANAGSDAELTCTTTSVTLDGSGSSTNPDANLTYAWSGPDGFTADTEDITVSAVGTYTLTVTDTDNGCFATDSAEVTADLTLPEVSIEPVQPLCIDAEIIQLIGTPQGGVWSGAADINGQFNPSNGTGIVIYTYTDVNGNGCTNSASLEIQVNPLPEVNIEEVDPLCIDADAIQLTASPSGGTWSGTGVDENGLFDPSLAGVGDTVITYTFTDNGNGGGNEECSALVLSAIFDGDLSGGLPKGVELYVLQDIPDLSVYGLGSATNGGGTDGVEFTFPADAATAGSYIYVTTNQDAFVNWFGFEPTYVEGTATNINGDDAIELFKNGEVIDTYGVIDVIGDFEPWDYTDSWAYRNSNTGPDGTTYSVGNWTYGGRSAWDGASSNASSNSIMPIGTYTNQNNTCSEGQGTGCTNFAEITITVNPLPEVSIQEVDVLCIDGDDVQLTGFPEGGTWSGAANEQGIFDPSLGSDSVTYTYTDINGCTNSATLFIEVSDLPIITAAAPVCEDSSTFGTYSVVVTVSDGIVTSLYSNSNQGENEWLVSDIPNGENAVITVTNQFGCESSVEVIAPECICIELEYSLTDITCFGLNDGKIIVDFVTDGATVLINGEPYNADTNYAPGEYTIQAFFEGNEDDRCFIESTFELTQPDQVNIEVSSTNVTCAGAADGTISIDFLSEGATYTIKKSGIGADLSGQEFFGPGWYVIEATIIDPETSTEFIQNGSLGRVVDPCTDIVIVTITEPQPFECEISTGFNPVKYACGEHKMNYLQANTTGGIGNLTYNWSMSGSVKGWEITSDPTESMIYFSLGFGTATFTVDITDENGCVTTCEYTIESPCSTKGTKPKSGSNGGSGWSFAFGRNAAQPVNTYPNPVKDLLSIEIKEDLDSQLTVEVFDLIGNRTFNKTYDSVQEGDVLKVDFSEFKSNVFYVKFNTKHGSFMKKVILDK